MKISRRRSPVQLFRLRFLSHRPRALRNRSALAVEESPSGNHRYSHSSVATSRSSGSWMDPRYPYDGPFRLGVANGAAAGHPLQGSHDAKRSAHRAGSERLADYRTVERRAGPMVCRRDLAWFPTTTKPWRVDQTTKKTTCILEELMRPASLHRIARAGRVVPMMQVRTSNSLVCGHRLQTGTSASLSKRGCTGGLCVCQ